MSLTSELNRVQYDGDGSTTAFTVSFVFWDDADIEVVHTDSSGVETTWVKGTQFTLSGGSGATGTVTAKTSPTDYTPALNEQLTIRSIRTDTQDTPIPLGGPLPTSALEQQLDQMVRQVQQKEEHLTRALTYPISEDTDTTNILPSIAARKGNLLAFDSTNGEPEMVAPSTLDAGLVPTPGGLGAGSVLRVNSGQTAYEERTIAQLRADLGAILDDLNTLGVVASDGQIIVGTGSGAFAYESGDTARISLGVGSTDVPDFDGVQLKTQKCQGFLFRVVNTSGTLQHQIVADTGDGAASAFVDKVTGASNSLANTPTVGGGTDFTSGAGITGNAIVFNVAAQTDVNNLCFGVIALNTSGTDITVEPFFTSRDVNGTTRIRLELQLNDTSTGSAFMITTGNIASSKAVSIKVLGYLT